MEDGATEDGERARARSQFRTKMARMSYYVERQSNPATAKDMSNVPPHLQNRY